MWAGEGGEEAEGGDEDQGENPPGHDDDGHALPELKHKLFNCQKSILYFHFLSISYVTDKVLQPFYGPRTPH